MPRSATILVASVVVMLAIGTILWRQGALRSVSQEKTEVMTETINIQGDPKEIFVTGELRHSIPLEDIHTGCPRHDCIPSIDTPKFESIETAQEWLMGDDIGLALSYQGVDRYYPFRILVSHEIVNDQINGERILVSYCPLCFTAIVFEPLVQGERVEFGVSGKLWNSNLLMYDRKTNETLWSQIEGEAVVGPLTGETLPIIPSDVARFKDWREAHPAGEVLSRDTGRIFSSYEKIPYGGDLTDIQPFFPYSNHDDRLDATDIVIGVALNGEQKAYAVDSVKTAMELSDTVGGVPIDVRYIETEDVVRVFRSDTGERVPTIPSFWFSWASTHPETDLYP